MERQHKIRFITMIIGSVIISLLLVAVSISMYFSSGTAQVDLSRPGYKSVQNQSRPEDPYKGFSASGKVDEQSLNDFNKMYKERAKTAISVDAFNSEALSDAALGIDDQAAPTE